MLILKHETGRRYRQNRIVSAGDVSPGNHSALPLVLSLRYFVCLYPMATVRLVASLPSVVESAVTIGYCNVRALYAPTLDKKCVIRNELQ